MTDIPSGQESDDLSLKCDDGGDDSANGAEPKPHQNVTNYDFKHPARVNKDQLRFLENLHGSGPRDYFHAIRRLQQYTSQLLPYFLLLDQSESEETLELASPITKFWQGPEPGSLHSGPSLLDPTLTAATNS